MKATTRPPREAARRPRGQKEIRVSLLFSLSLSLSLDENTKKKRRSRHPARGCVGPRRERSWNARLADVRISAQLLRGLQRPGALLRATGETATGSYSSSHDSRLTTTIRRVTTTAHTSQVRLGVDARAACTKFGEPPSAFFARHPRGVVEQLERVVTLTDRTQARLARWQHRVLECAPHRAALRAKRKIALRLQARQRGTAFPARSFRSFVKLKTPHTHASLKKKTVVVVVGEDVTGAWARRPPHALWVLRAALRNGAAARAPRLAGSRARARDSRGRTAERAATGRAWKNRHLSSHEFARARSGVMMILLIMT